MIKTRFFTSYSLDNLEAELNYWIERRAEQDPTFKVKDFQYTTVVRNNNIYSNVLVIYEEETKWEKERRYKYGMQLAGILEGESDGERENEI